MFCLNWLEIYFIFGTKSIKPKIYSRIKMIYVIKNLGTMSENEVTQAFAAIPPGVSTLDLSRNYFYEKSGTELAQSFAAIPKGVNTLDLSWNVLYKKSRAELVQAFEAISQTVTSLDLEGNDFWKKSAEELTLIFNAIPQNVARVSLSVEELNQMSPEQRKAIQNRYPCVEQVILVDAEDKNRKLNPTLSRIDTNAYVRFGFKVSPQLCFIPHLFLLLKIKKNCSSWHRVLSKSSIQNSKKASINLDGNQ
ncbi:hypothetical protein A6J40_16505 [Legionella longbeachae]|uniref:Leucine-rich repeat-containing protein (Substrate of the Dot/Icm secretion system) n=3 Tax=Legionella longbeachae TaxID=450 RepID=D3HKF0_LEGLN|nr:hypothetical protein A6J40_16505 [Legionella longbeachae]EEZ93963.1 leucine-rich repeat-containing protein [Legionella longbeachae D-4968]CBJ12914.1 hypothetical protein LLO_2494 [Legionella longbeachae NSW150]HBD7397707.1 hypothetical protein [Legionella pneumophila]ARM33184.1 hypothetical protein B0B39_06460 [Legionella longbeachae]